MAEQPVLVIRTKMKTLPETLKAQHDISTQTNGSMPYSAALDVTPAPRTPPAKQLEDMRVAIVHHWFISRAGGERVFDAIASIFPTADVFTLFLDKQKFLPALHK